MKKRRTQAGETLVETLVAVLVVSTASMILAGAVVASAQVNSRVRNADVAFSVAEEAGAAFKVRIQSGGDATDEEVLLYETNGYYYYDVPTGP